MFRALLILVCAQAVLSYDYYDSKPQYAQYQRQQPQGWSHSALINAVNNRTSTWKAGPTSRPLESYRTGVFLEDVEEHRLPKGILILKEDVNLPEHFDARTKWSQCPSLREVRDQGCCGSCWAVSAASVFSDRWCIHSQEHEQFTFGSLDLITCCHSCGEGCQGGYLGPAWTYWVQKGVASGGPYNSRQGCRSYPFTSCSNPDHDEDTPKCSRSCQSTYKTPENYKDRRFGRVAYSLPSDELRIMEEIFINGPVQAAFAVYTDFKMYKSGVYRHVVGTLEGGHAVKVVGWGVENGVKYWLVANSWGEDWGDRGFFKIVRGENHLGFEADVHAGLPHLARHNPAKMYNSYNNYNNYNNNY